MVASNSRTIEFIIGARNESRHAFQEASNDMQALLLRSRETGRELSAFGRLAANAERQDVASVAQAALPRIAPPGYAEFQQSAAHEANLYATQAGDQMRQKESARLAADIQGRADLARQQASMSAELNAAAAAARSEYLAQEQAAILAAAREEHAQMQMQVADRRAMTDRIYAATHSARETDLRSLRRYYAQMRLEHRGNTQMLALIDKAYAAERDALLASGGGGLRGLFARGGVMRQGLRMVGSTAAFSVSPELGLASGMISGAGLGAAALPVGAAFAAIGLLVAGFKACTDAVKDAEKAMKEYAEYGRQTVEMQASVYAATRAPTGLEGDLAALRQIDKQIEETRNRETDKTSWWNSVWTGEYGVGNAFGLNKLWGGNEESTGAMLTKQAEAQKDAALIQQENLRKEFTDYLGRKRESLEFLKQAHEQDAIEDAKIAAMYEGPAKARAALQQKQAAELRDAQQKNYVTPGAVDEEAIKKKHAEQLVGLERQEQEIIRRDRLAAQESQINATQEGYAREIALLELKHLSEIEEYDRAGRDKTDMLQRQANERIVLAKNEARELQQLWNQYTVAWVAANLRGAEAEKTAMEYRHKQELINVTDPERRRVIEQRQEQERLKFNRDAADRNEDLAYQTVEARLRLIRDANEREMELLKLRQIQERKAAKEAGLDMGLLAEKQAAEREALLRSRERKVSIPVVERGFLTQAPGQYDPWKEMNQQQKQANKTAADGNKLSEQAIKLLAAIVEKLGVKEAVADFNN